VYDLEVRKLRVVGTMSRLTHNCKLDYRAWKNRKSLHL
jgi:hypothetical protein